MGYAPIVVVAVIPTVIAFWFVAARPNLGIWCKVVVAGTWVASSIPLGGVIFALSAMFYLSSVGHGAWDQNPKQGDLAVAAPLSILLNGSLMLIAWGLDAVMRRRKAAA